MFGNCPVLLRGRWEEVISGWDSIGRVVVACSRMIAVYYLHVDGKVD
jgi:hypothetical protein